ncbi:MAG TPA: hypothetical protein P5519_05435 [Spirochaetia bacterium]|nr:hypothetical protein [Spirochaetales bacterium]HPD80933.1 hypothetical protein [Spirochaetales bacterium]HRS65312.1 hypothetical protein [Spirochaetia bacterium]
MGKSRELIPGGTYYIMVQSHCKVFLQEQDYCRKVFLEFLFALQAEYGFSIDRFVLFQEKIHMILTTVNNELPQVMKRLLMNFSIHINRQFGMSGHVWDRRYYSRVLWTKEEKAIWSNQLTKCINSLTAKSTVHTCML